MTRLARPPQCRRRDRRYCGTAPTRSGRSERGSSCGNRDATAPTFELRAVAAVAASTGEHRKKLKTPMMWRRWAAVISRPRERTAPGRRSMAHAPVGAVGISVSRGRGNRSAMPKRGHGKLRARFPRSAGWARPGATPGSCFGGEAGTDGVDVRTVVALRLGFEGNTGSRRGTRVEAGTAWSGSIRISAGCLFPKTRSEPHLRPPQTRRRRSRGRSERNDDRLRALTEQTRLSSSARASSAAY